MMSYWRAHTVVTQGPTAICVRPFCAQINILYCAKTLILYHARVITPHHDQIKMLNHVKKKRVQNITLCCGQVIM